MASPRAVPSALNRRIRCPLHRRLSCHQHDRQQGRRARIRQTVRASVDARQHSVRVVDPRAQSVGETVAEIQGGSVGREPETIANRRSLSRVVTEPSDSSRRSTFSADRPTRLREPMTSRPAGSMTPSLNRLPLWRTPGPVGADRAFCPGDVEGLDRSKQPFSTLRPPDRARFDVSLQRSFPLQRWGASRRRECSAGISRGPVPPAQCCCTTVCTRPITEPAPSRQCLIRAGM